MSFSDMLKQRHIGILSYLTDRAVVSKNRREDHFLRGKFANLSCLRWKDLIGHFGCVNAIEFSQGDGQFIASGGDDRRVLLWNVEKALSDIGKPAVMKGEHNSNIFCIGFDLNNQTIFSGGNDEQVIVHDINTGETKDVFPHEDAVYGLSPDPTNPHVFASACDDGRILIFDTRDSLAEPFCLANYTSSMHSVMYNPVEPRLLATANAKEGVGLWDVRKPRSCLLRYGGSLVQQSCMSVRFNQHGDQLIALRRRLPPVLYKLHSHEPVCEFDHSGYYNSCTMKSICYAGDNDQYILSGSDEFNLYMWAVPEDLSERMYINSAHMVLKGHRSIVNQVRFNPANHLIISSGVEKIIKVWSAFKLSSKMKKSPDVERGRERRVYTHEEYINLVLQDGHVMSHDYSHMSTDEDPRTMAFFDSLVQCELDGWSSDDSMSSNEEALYSRIVQLSQSDIDSDDSIPDIDDVAGPTEPHYSPFTIAFASVMASEAAEGNDRFPRLNRALDNIERSYRNASNEGNVEQDSSSETSSAQADDQEERQTVLNNNSTEVNNILTELVRKKKTDMKESLRKRMKDLKRSTVNSSFRDLCSDSDSDTSSVSSQNIEIGETKGEEDEKVRNPSCIKPVEKSEQPSETQKKLKLLNSLRKRVLNDSDSSDLEILEKEISESGSGRNEDHPVEKVQFKKFKRKHVEVNPSESKEKGKSRGLPDQGPFIKESMVSSDRKLSNEKTKGGKRNPNDSSLSGIRGKHKLKKPEATSDCDEKSNGPGRNQRDDGGKSSKQSSGKTRHHSDSVSDRHRHGERSSRHHGYHHKSSHRRNSFSDTLYDEDRYKYYSSHHYSLDRPRDNQGDSERNSGRRHSDSSKRSKHTCSDKCPLSKTEVRSSTKAFVKDTKYEDLSEDTSDNCEGRDKVQGKPKLERRKYETEIRTVTVHSVKDTKPSDKSESTDNESRERNRHKSVSLNNRELEDGVDEAIPSCSYSRSKSDHTQSRDESHKNRHTKNRTSSKDRDHHTDSDTNSDSNQPTWREFKRFKKRLERARKRYKDEKQHRRHRDTEHDRRQYYD